MTTDARYTSFRRTVLEFFRAHGRKDLPWRKTEDPYKILISEIMLQQTQVHRVIGKYKEFLEKFPTVKKLAQASLVDVLNVWSGLGYNRRAKYLHDAARAIVQNHAGKIPESYEELRALPGIGDYTAKAVRAFAFNMPETFIETNIRAVFIHHFFPRKKKVEDKELFPIVEAAIGRREPRIWYSALMDYGTHLKHMYPNPSRRSTHHSKQSRFEGSLRQVRGAILKAIAKNTSLTDVRRSYKDAYTTAFQSLVSEGLVDKSL